MKTWIQARNHFLFCGFSVAMMACAHTVEFKSVPQGADVTLNGRVIGKTPLLYVAEASTSKSDRIVMELPGIGRKEQIEERHACTGVGNLLANLAWVGLMKPYCLRNEYSFVIKSN